jgi:hypothetical protein
MLMISTGKYISPPCFKFKWDPRVFYKYFYNHARRPRLELRTNGFF